MLRVRSYVSAAILCVAMPAAAAAQVTTADIVGRVVDASGGVLPGVTVTLENVGTHDVRTTATNGSGDYVFTLLAIGSYSIKIQLEGFTGQNSRVTISAGDRARIDARLQLGTISENVTVAAEAPLVQ